VVVDVALELRVLGEVDARIDGQPVDLGHARQQCVLAVLMLHANHVVQVDQLVDGVWGSRPPRDARKSLRTYMSRLRAALAGEVEITHRRGGYVLALDAAVVDLYRFRDLLARARATGDDEHARVLFGQALGLWRGEAFAGLDTPWIVTKRHALEQDRFAAELDYTDMRLRCGEHAHVLPELSARVEAHPLDERLAAQFILALYRGGRQAEALRHYQRIRRRLADELGTDPGPQVQQVHQQILAANPALSVVSVPVPRQLPASPRVFTGRAHKLAALTRALDRAGEGANVMISVIGGTAGIGKTALALHWAHQHADQFPDGQLFVNLHGFDPTADPTPPEQALRGFLDTLGVDPRSIPADLDAQTGLYRSLLTGKRMLIVLDNAADSTQLGPLLPGSPTCTVLITSQHRLSGLAVNGARPLDLDVLCDCDARHLLAAHLGEDRLAAEPEAVDELLRWCAGLPLAISIVAARAAAHPDFPLTALAGELHDATTRLEALDAGELSANLCAVLDSSYRALDRDTATLFGLLGLAPGPDISLPAAGNLVIQARPLLRQLETASLVQQHLPDRYRMHDLIRLYATEQAERKLPEEVRESALRRLADFYLHTAYAADRLLHPQRIPIDIAPPVLGCRPHPLTDTATALRWFETEHPCLLTTQQLAATHGWHTVVWHLAWTLNGFQWRQGRIRDLVACWQTGLAAAEQLADPTVLAWTHRYLGHAHAQAGEHVMALDYLRRALSLAERVEDTVLQAHIHSSLSRAWAQQNNDQQALAHATHFLRLSRALDDPAHEAEALNAVGWHYARLGCHDQARDACGHALGLSRQHRYRDNEANTLDSLGYIAHHTGQPAHALDYYRQALILFHELDNVYQEANTLDRLGEVHATWDHQTEARAVWQQALELYRTQHRTADAERIQRKLAERRP
jgi:DNA-binding SARP family transcriptional activator/tetratricopeptide (TPR) repeat protein